MIKIERSGNSDSKYLNMSKRELIDEIVDHQIKEIGYIKHIKSLIQELEEAGLNSVPKKETAAPKRKPTKAKENKDKEQDIKDGEEIVKEVSPDTDKTQTK